MFQYSNLFNYDTFHGVYNNIAIYLKIISFQTTKPTKYDEAHIDLRNGNIRFYNYIKNL